MTSKAGIWISAAAVLALTGAWQCAAAADVQTDQTIVHFGDLNVDRPAGTAVLYRRIRHAAEGVCGERRDPGTQTISSQWRSCVAQAIGGAVVSLDRPALTAYHRLQAAPSDQGASAAMVASSR
jgi:UrcA family protein